MGGPYGSEGYNDYLRRQQELAAQRQAEAKAAHEAAMARKDEESSLLEDLQEMDAEQRKVITWRLKRLRDAGMEYDHAIVLANDFRGVDLHEACDLTKVSGGALAFRILANE